MRGRFSRGTCSGIMLIWHSIGIHMQTHQASTSGTRPPLHILLALLLAVIANMPAHAEIDESTQTHDIYNLSRTAIINAQRQLAKSYQQQQEVLERTARMHDELQKSLALLAKAEQLDPANKSKIEAVRENLAKLEDRSALCPMDNASSLDVYKQLLDELQTLIEQF